jgi:hypothetical protein
MAGTEKISRDSAARRVILSAVQQNKMNERNIMKPSYNLCRFIVVAAFALSALGVTWPARTLAAEGKGASKLMPVKTVGDLQTVEKGDILVMSCPKCKDTYATVVEKSFKGMKREELETVVIHLCPSCETKIVTTGPGKFKTDKLVHACKTCGSEDVTCCLMKKNGGTTKGMEEKK